LKKQVKFTDDLKSCSDVMTTVAAEKMIVEHTKITGDVDPTQGL
jgi:hypothetical protein